MKLADLPVFGMPVRLVWRKRHRQRPPSERAVASFHGAGRLDSPGAGAVDQPGGTVGNRAGRAAEVAKDLGCA